VPLDAFSLLLLLLGRLLLVHLVHPAGRSRRLHTCPPPLSFLPSPTSPSLPSSSFTLHYLATPQAADGSALEVHKHQSAKSQEMRSLFSTKSQETIGIGNILPRQQPKKNPLRPKQQVPHQLRSVFYVVTPPKGGRIRLFFVKELSRLDSG